MKLDYSNVLEAFAKAGIHYAVVGGFAAVAHGSVRVTMDLDLALGLSPESLQGAWDVLQGLGFHPRQPITQSQFVNPVELKKIAADKGMKAVSFVQRDQLYLVVDVLFGDEFQLKDSEVIELPLFGFKSKVVTVKKLIELKRAAGRPKDLEDIRELEKLKK